MASQVEFGLNAIYSEIDCGVDDRKIKDEDARFSISSNVGLQHSDRYRTDFYSLLFISLF